MASPAVEAKSLSTLTSLASNPPQYPRNPTHERHEPLVLYIARVPGSRDVFLTPIKPREKVVTAEDIQSSLYYLHFDNPEDNRFIEAPPEPANQNDNSYSQSSRLPVPPRIPRKAVPTANLHNPPRELPAVPGPLQARPVPSVLAARGDVANRHNIAAGGYANPPAYPPNPHGVQNERQLPVRPPHGRQQNLDYLPVLPPRPDYPVRPASYHSGTTITGPVPKVPSPTGAIAPYLAPPQPSRQTSSEGFLQSDNVDGISLTLIRRDPASGAQWNVARIEDPPVPEVSSDVSGSPKKRTGAPMYIEITNPGYSKFLHTPEGISPIPTRSPSDLLIKSATLTGANPIPSDESNPLSNKVFRRRLWMEGSKFSDRTFGHRKNSSQDVSIGRPVSRENGANWKRDLKEPSPYSGGPHFLSRDDQAGSAVQIGSKTSSFRGYVFMSPWNGRCEFSTGGGGSSLKCKHILSGLQGGVPPPPATVSELRFNLPGTTPLLPTPRNEESKRSSFFHRPRHSRNNSSLSDIRFDSTEDVRTSLDRMDLSLGQEFAGGGFGGKQAKLGKLIIGDEGLKMMDLLVAANLALWWRAYEKIDKKTRGRSASLQGVI